MRMLGFFQLLELSALDQLFRLRPLEKPDSRIVIVGIDESDLKKVGKWPIPDTVLAQLLKKVQQQKPRAIGLDIYRDLPVEPGYGELVQVFESTPNLIGIQKVVGYGLNQTVAPSPLLSKLGKTSANDFPWDVDGKIRRGFLYLKGKEGKNVYSLGFKLAWLYLEEEGIQPKMKNEIQIQLGQAIFTPFETNDGGYVGASAQGYQILLNYRGPQQTFETVSLADVLENRIKPNLMRDRIVLIGSTAKSVKDYLLTPYSSNLVSIPQPMAGVEIHANMTSQIISAALEGRSLIKTLSEPLEWLWILGWSALGATLTCKWRDIDGVAKISFLRTGSRIVLFSGILIGSGYIAFVGNLWVPVFPALLTLIGATIVKTGYTLWENLKLSYKQIEEYSRTLEVKVEQRTQELQTKNEELDGTLQQLRAAQKQMIAQEKLASLGSLTAGIAHEIRNPLNFVTNFATISVDLAQELKEEIENQTENLEAEAVEYINEIFTDLTESVVEIEKQGKRIESILLGMMMHAQQETGKPELTALNSLLAESVQLAYQSFRANKETVEIMLKLQYDEPLGDFYIVPQDISKAVVNIINNACYTVNQKKKVLGDKFTPIIEIKAINLEDRAEIYIGDNGEGISQDIIDKIFNPFFTTKPPGEGTGLGLSITHEIIVGQHQGEIKVKSVLDSHTEFIIVLPRNALESQTVVR
ncbi:CHASE2 domain-containing protein [Microcoleus sp. FACHB-68]|uniref:CHASE2 domain-containing protein n=1 Tax=Microcoleus sp. FACHB-68 TaxID=2692826 RepID=UPI001685F832|nr:CHASE2 domain-containing protein [Microcoleus sp. FACHB-68]MBD1939565.1 CHASE2 domain-containing protein [Microcoleus sp. FACHB-68]